MGRQKRLFIKDLRTGRLRGERRVLNVLRSRWLEAGPNRARKRARQAQYDLFCRLPGGRRVTVEVKFDAEEARTGNVAVEYNNPRANKPSGILATTADVWVFVLTDGSVWGTQTADLRSVFESGKAAPAFKRIVKWCGDGNADAVLYNRPVLFDHIFTRLDTLSDDDLLHFLRGNPDYSH